MIVGTQFTGSINPTQTKRWFTFNWPANWDVVWSVVPTSPKLGAPQLEWDVAVERATAAYITYWISIRNLTTSQIDIEARYAIMNL